MLLLVLEAVPLTGVGPQHRPIIRSLRLWAAHDGRAATHYRVQIFGIWLDTGASRARFSREAAGVRFPLVRATDGRVGAMLVPSASPEKQIYGRDRTLC